MLDNSVHLKVFVCRARTLMLKETTASSVRPITAHAQLRVHIIQLLRGERGVADPFPSAGLAGQALSVVLQQLLAFMLCATDGAWGDQPLRPNRLTPSRKLNSTSVVHRIGPMPSGGPEKKRLAPGANAPAEGGEPSRDSNPSAEGVNKS